MFCYTIHRLYFSGRQSNFPRGNITVCYACVFCHGGSAMKMKRGISVGQCKTQIRLNLDISSLQYTDAKINNHYFVIQHDINLNRIYLYQKGGKVITPMFQYKDLCRLLRYRNYHYKFPKLVKRHLHLEVIPWHCLGHICANTWLCNFPTRNHYVFRHGYVGRQLRLHIKWTSRFFIFQ